MKEKEYQGQRKEKVEADAEGVDRKFLYHTVRLLFEAEQIVELQNLDLRRDRELYKSIRAGAISLQEIEGIIERKLDQLDEKFSNSKLPEAPDHSRLKTLLLKCLEIHYGSIDNLVKVNKTSSDIKLQKIMEIINE